MATVPIKYATDEKNNKFSPITSIQSIYDYENTRYWPLDNLYANREELLFIGTAKIGTPVVGSFTVASFQTVNFGSGNFSNGGFVDNTLGALGEGIYKITLSYQADWTRGNYPQRDIFVRISLNNDTLDGNGIWGNQTYDRYARGFSQCLKLTGGTNLKVKYYTEHNASFGTVMVAVTRIQIVDSRYGSSPVKYSVDENGNKFSPITGSESVYIIDNPRTGGGTSLAYLSKPYPSSIYSCYFESMIFSAEVQECGYNTPVSSSVLKYNFVNSVLINTANSTTNTIPRIQVKYPGWYLVTVGGRIADVPSVRPFDYGIYAEKSGSASESKWCFAMRGYERRTFSGCAIFNLNANDYLQLRIFSDAVYRSLGALTVNLEILYRNF